MLDEYELEINKITKLDKLVVLLSQLIYQVTCIECCKLFSVPTTAKCGHTLCHTCWRGRHKCPTCGVHNSKSSLKLNLPLQNQTKHIQLLRGTFEDLFKINLDEHLLDSLDENDIEQDPSKNVTDWLASSQNHFSMQPTNSAQSTQDTSVCVEHVTSHAIVHSETKSRPVPMELEYVPPKEQDWDKIEEMPGEIHHKNKENIVGPMDIENFDYIVDDNKEYTNEKPRRSFRNKENTRQDMSNISNDIATNAHCNSTSSMETNKKSNKTLKTWNNVKKMKKDLNKVHKKNKLNVSIEVCKKTQAAASKVAEPADSQVVYSIDDNTPEVTTKLNDKSDTKVVNKSNIDKTVGNKITSCANETSLQQVKIREASVHSHSKTKENQRENIKPSRDNVNTDKSHNNLSVISNQNKNTVKNVSFLKKSSFVSNNQYNKLNNDSKEQNVQCVNTDDIEIIIKVGSTVANIYIKKKDNDVQLNVQANPEVQTSRKDVNNQMNKPDVIDVQIEKTQNQVNITKSIHPSQSTIGKTDINVEQKSVSTKKNTASADTVTAEITESVEKELFQTMPNTKSQVEVNTTVKSSSQALREIEQNVAELNDLDLFDSESVKEGHVQYLKETKKTPSAILVPTYKSCNKERTAEKRSRDDHDEKEIPSTKKSKVVKKMDVGTIEENSFSEDVHKPNTLECSEMDDYNNIISQVFANIDADINHMKKNKSRPGTQKTIKSTKRSENAHPTQKYSENVFSILEKDSSGLEDDGKKQDTPSKSILVEERIEDIEVTTEKQTSPQNDSVMVVQNTPAQEDSLSGQSVVEETPQKSASFSKARTRGDSANNKSKNIIRVNSTERRSQRNSSTRDTNVITLCDTVVDTTKTAEKSKGRPTLETPVTINKFVDQIKYKSTPVAKKSLDFDDENIDQTFCSSFVAAKTTQEKEFMSKAFEQSYSPSRTLVAKKVDKDMKCCIAGSCLTSQQQLNLKKLCALRSWTFTDTYTKELTHLVVGVDEENKAQRSVKFMLALAAGRWIVSYEWVAKCLQTQDRADEEAFEALDGTGAGGPRRARLAAGGRRLFAGLTFVTHPPYTVLTEDTLKEMLVSAGGRVLEAPAPGAARGEAPPLLLAEPEHTQEDRFLYLALERGVVPVNYEWALNCLGAYSLAPVLDLLLCPAALLPSTVERWPPELVAQDE